MSSARRPRSAPTTRPQPFDVSQPTLSGAHQSPVPRGAGVLAKHVASSPSSPRASPSRTSFPSRNPTKSRPSPISITCNSLGFVSPSRRGRSYNEAQEYFSSVRRVPKLVTSPRSPSPFEGLQNASPRNALLRSVRARSASPIRAPPRNTSPRIRAGPSTRLSFVGWEDVPRKFYGRGRLGN